MYENALLENFDVERIPLGKLEDMMSAKPGNKHFMRLPYYDILTKRKYCWLFEFHLMSTHQQDDDPFDGGTFRSQSFRTSIRSTRTGPPFEVQRPETTAIASPARQSSEQKAGQLVRNEQ